jgi:hypothetical protein
MSMSGEDPMAGEAEAADAVRVMSTAIHSLLEDRAGTDVPPAAGSRRFVGPVRSADVADLRRRVGDGSYVVDPHAVAGALLRHLLADRDELRP